MNVKKQESRSENRGLRCRQCECRHFRVIYTRSGYKGTVKRRRECRNCGERITTWERAIGGELNVK